MAYRLIGAKELSEPIWPISIQPKGTNSSEILIEILIFSFGAKPLSKPMLGINENAFE